jgi:CubicO group peptidase (beta-lactamase class C family)
LTSLAPELGGFVAPGFERVADAFERNFVERDELGASFSAVRDGETVVDLHGGLADRASREEQDGRAETLLRVLHEAVA